MSTSEPPEGPEGRPRPEAEADAFEALVAGWRAEGTVPEWPAAEPEIETLEPQLDPEEHYIPPEPPPLPRPGAAVGVGLVLVALGVVLVAAPQWIGMSSVYGLPLGLVAIAGGLTWLLMRLWQPAGVDEDPYDDEGTI